MRKNHDKNGQKGVLIIGFSIILRLAYVFGRLLLKPLLWLFIRYI